MGFGSVSWDATQFDAALKDYYMDPIRDLLNSKTILYNRIARNEEDVSGRQVYASLRVGRNQGIGAAGRGGKLPEPQQQEYSATKFTTQRLYARIMVDGQGMAESRDSAGAFIDVLDGEINNVVQDFGVDVNRQLFGNGSGILAKITNVATAVYTVSTAGGYTNLSNGTKYLKEKMVVTAINPATGASRGIAYDITAVNASAGTFTTSTALGGPAQVNDWVVRANENGVNPNAASHGYNNELMGIRGIFDDADPPTIATGLQNLTVAAAPWWVSKVMSNGGTSRNLSLDLLQESEDELDIHCDSYPSLWLSNHAQRRRYLDLMEASKRFVDRLTLDGGFKALEYNEVPWVVDKDMVGGLMYGFDEDPLALYQMGDISWMDKDGSILHRDDDIDRFQAALVWYAQLGTSNRRPAVVIEDLAE